jgi:hypothetical protein
MTVGQLIMKLVDECSREDGVLNMDDPVTVGYRSGGTYDKDDLTVEEVQVLLDGPGGSICNLVLAVENKD